MINLFSVILLRSTVGVTGKVTYLPRIDKVSVAAADQRATPGFSVIWLDFRNFAATSSSCWACYCSASLASVGVVQASSIVSRPEALKRTCHINSWLEPDKMHAPKLTTHPGVCTSTFLDIPCWQIASRLFLSGPGPAGIRTSLMRANFFGLRHVWESKLHIKNAGFNKQSWQETLSHHRCEWDPSQRPQQATSASALA